jgi:hypothetical protein
MWLLPQVWRFDGIEFAVGRPEMVVTDPEYRRRGLVRALFDEFHRRSAANGELVQAITGIRYFYRQFGYEYALDLGGGRRVLFTDIPPLKAGETEPYRPRDVAAADLPFVMAVYERQRQRGLVSVDIPEVYWRWMIDEANHDSGDGWRAMLIVDGDDKPRGYALPRSRRGGSVLDVRDVALADGVAYLSVTRSLLRGLRELAATIPVLPGREDAAPDRLMFSLGATHPLYDALGTALAPHYDPPYAWYVRVPDLPRFIRHIAPALERRLAHSVATGYTGELRLDFYRGGLRLAFDKGHLAIAEDWQRPASGGEVEGAFPPLVFLQLLFGRRSLAELRHAYPDVWATSDTTPVINALFPPRFSHLLDLN